MCTSLITFVSERYFAVITLATTEIEPKDLFDFLFYHRHRLVLKSLEFANDPLKLYVSPNLLVKSAVHMVSNLKEIP